MRRAEWIRRRRSRRSPRKREIESRACAIANQASFLSDDDLENIKKRCEEATPGSWKSYVQGREEIVGSDFTMTEGEDIYLAGATAADQDFIAHSWQDIPRLVAEAERLRKIAEMRSCP